MAGNTGGSKGPKQQNVWAKILQEINSGKRTMGSLPLRTQQEVKKYRTMRAGVRKKSAEWKQYTDSRIAGDAYAKKLPKAIPAAIKKINAGTAKITDYSPTTQAKIRQYRKTAAGKRAGVPKAIQKINTGKASITQYSPGTQARIRKTRAEGAAKRAAATKKASKPVTGRPGR